MPRDVTEAPDEPSPVPTAVEQPRASAMSSVMVYVKMRIEKHYGVLAKLSGKENSTERSLPYDVDNAWWDNPLLVYADPPYVQPDVTAGADSQAIVGEGASSNVTVKVQAVPRAVVTVKTVPKTDAIEGTIHVTIGMTADYFDGEWTRMANEDNKQLTFHFDTRDPRKKAEAVGHETRTIPHFSFERYTRDQEKWESKSRWPTKPVSGDWRAVIYGKNATLDVTSYRYVE